jgi:hypothetical protein
LETAIRALDSDLTADDYENAYDKALEDLSLTSEPSSSFLDSWVVSRMKRWLFQYRLESVSENFDVPKAKLQQVFANYEKLILGLDEAFEKAVVEYPDLFGICSAEGIFGMTVSSGFVTDSITGEDLTYDSEDGVLINGR